MSLSDDFKEINKFGKVALQTEEARDFLKKLKDFYLVSMKVADPYTTERFSCFREGQNDIVRMLLILGGLLNEREHIETDKFK